ncbi:hypothetical protein CPB83DRAFT_881231 [Crepidotus variabilis]|uniref:Uncharacterized protein n=1 Tax=Crepidotus variabilis TaxID=179855 RepID=A0A9P6JSQ4_9AGAR|nr:hypothetical protein CPB83DRAFT_881231 [Crepidotus variabilis]
MAKLPIDELLRFHKAAEEEIQKLKKEYQSLHTSVLHNPGNAEEEIEKLKEQSRSLHTSILHHLEEFEAAQNNDIHEVPQENQDDPERTGIQEHGPTRQQEQEDRKRKEAEQEARRVRLLMKQLSLLSMTKMAGMVLAALLLALFLELLGWFIMTGLFVTFYKDPHCASEHCLGYFFPGFTTLEYCGCKSSSLQNPTTIEAKTHSVFLDLQSINGRIFGGKNQNPTIVATGTLVQMGDRKVG